MCTIIVRPCGGVRRSQSRRATPRPHGGQIEEAAARVCVRTYPRVAAHTGGGGRGRAGGRAGAQARITLAAKIQ